MTRTYAQVDPGDDDQFDWYDEYEDGDRCDYETACIDCGAPGIDLCCCCGGWLCGMHGEIGAGFCRDCPTDEWINEQEALINE